MAVTQLDVFASFRDRSLGSTVASQRRALMQRWAGGRRWQSLAQISRRPTVRPRNCFSVFQSKLEV
jgi:hypothetical protein